MDATCGFCRGCLRTLDEIAAWGDADEAERIAILAAVARRRQDFDPWDGPMRRNCEP
jgi:predicted Fe-S protein YdhL (DUF1289 family)